MKSETRQIYKERILRVLVHIQNNLDETLPLSELARVAHFSPYHFHRVFRGMVGESVKEHVRRLRLERAVQRLKSTRISVTRIAFESGYETHESFIRAFRAMFGMAPSQMRKNRQPPPSPNAPSGVHFAATGDISDFIPVDTGGTSMEAKIEKMAPMRVAFVRHVGPYNQCQAAWGTLCAWAGRHRITGPGIICLGVCHDDPEVTPLDKVRYDACLTVGADVRPEGDVGIQEIGGGEYATTTHRGSYENLHETYAKLCGQWIPTQGREVSSAPSIEIYRNDPTTTKPEDLVTDIYVRLDPR